MAIFDFLFGKKQTSAAAGRDRLQIMIAQDRSSRHMPDYLPTLQRELLEVLSRYVAVSPEDVQISHQKQEGVDVLELNITLPERKPAAADDTASAPAGS